MKIMEAENWDEIFSENISFNDAYEKFIRVVNKAIHASTLVINSFRRNKAPWAIRRISKLAAKKSRKCHAHKSSLLQTDYDAFKSVLMSFLTLRTKLYLLKKEDRMSSRNYRPVSLTPIIARVLESTFYDI